MIPHQQTVDVGALDSSDLPKLAIDMAIDMAIEIDTLHCRGVDM